ncbi:GTPase HflX [Candidatus Poribacteria bacterium]|jgi:GTPase|nr:GTPase HflX [Candidatus Poribacteria bacterium]MBT5531519.1 GTPase HflX [Candidatus Poribacteria bacterium]MBT5710161.1 GTPase HflX [Candidatus Poribacteria bacterium]MBT7101724.1 GTPase HflX [Candidatus Poribacteria bacterium]MBT7807920.1 GTPase HflX [Candidatus Poribacteria bacterium]
MDLFELRARIEQTERAILVGVEWTGREGDTYSVQDSMAELAALAETAGVEVVCQVVQRRNRPHAATLIGSGKVDELRVLNEEVNADLYLFDDELSPGQMRNLDKTLDSKVLDRTDVILDIFAQRARTKEAKLQVELAQLEYAIPRLRRAWTHLSRVGGGSGVGGGVGTRGPGRTQLEMDQRLIQRRIKQVRKDLGDMRRQRRVQRSARTKEYTASLVGYTNAGKSSVLNALTGERHVATEDKLFKTLDPTTRQLDIDDGRSLLVTDTVGFIQRLPHRLVAAFRATLEEVLEADLLLHVVDVAHANPVAQIASVNEVLAELEALDIPTLLVLNKVDLLDDAKVLSDIKAEYPDAIPVSSVTGDGMDSLRHELSTRAGEGEQEYEFRLPHERGRLLSYLYEHGQVDDVDYGELEVTVRAHLHPKHIAPLRDYVS